MGTKYDKDLNNTVSYNYNYNHAQDEQAGEERGGSQKTMEQVSVLN
jgi:hypothetical protein